MSVKPTSLVLKPQQLSQNLTLRFKISCAKLLLNFIHQFMLQNALAFILKIGLKYKLSEYRVQQGTTATIVIFIDVTQVAQFCNNIYARSCKSQKLVFRTF